MANVGPPSPSRAWSASSCRSASRSTAPSCSSSRIKEDVRNGANLRTSVDKSFSTAYSTIVKADISSLIGALVLYWLSVGPVRGFALYLGIATVLDLVSAYFFLRPATVRAGPVPSG